MNLLNHGEQNDNFSKKIVSINIKISNLINIKKLRKVE